jgi:hypothetical protein
MLNMRNKTLFIILVSLFAVFTMVGTSMAANSVTMLSDKPIIPKSECGHGGNISLLFDADTIMHEGDVIRFLLSADTAVCGNINYFLSMADEGDETILNATDDPIQSTSAGGDFTIFSNGTQVAGAAAIISNSAAGTLATEDSEVEVGFLVQATNGSRYITLTLGVRDLSGPAGQAGQVFTQSSSDLTVTYNPTNPDDELTIKLFDGGSKNNADGIADFWEKDVDGLYLDDIADLEDYADNVLCIDTSSFTGSQVYAIPESRPANSDNTYQLSFLGDYIIAQIVEGVTYTIEQACKDEICNLFDIGLSVNQAGEEIADTGDFDFGNYGAGTPTADRWVSENYCTGPTYGNGIIFYSEDSFAEGEEYEITLTVRTGSTANPDVTYWLGATPEATYYTNSNSESNCDVDAPALVASGAGGWNYLVDATRASGFDESVQTGTYTITAAETVNNAIMIDLDDVRLDLTEVSAGEKVYVDVSVVKLPCGGAIQSATICLAELVDGCPGPVFTGTNYIDGICFIGDRMLADVMHGYLARTNTTTDNTSSAVFFPYAPALNDDTFFTGIAITAIGTNDVNLTVTITDSAGGSASYTTTTPVPAGGQMVFTLDSLIDDLVDGTTPLDLDENCSVRITAAAAP